MFLFFCVAFFFLIRLVCTNFGVEDLRPEMGIFKGAESKYGISFVSSHQVYELRYMQVLVKSLTVHQFNNIEKNESSIKKFVLKFNRKDLASKYFLIELNFMKM